MNIFYLSHNVNKCAEWSFDSHCVKMILEYAQLLSTAHRFLDGTMTVEMREVKGSFPIRYRRVKVWHHPEPSMESKLYAVTHVNHKCAIWCRESESNYIWLRDLLNAFCKEYTHRYGKIHKVEREGLLSKLWYAPKNINKSDSFTPPPNAMDAKYIISDDTTDNYKNYYVVGKEHLHKWTKRTMPKWMQQYADMNTWRT